MAEPFKPQKKAYFRTFREPDAANALPSQRDLLSCWAVLLCYFSILLMLSVDESLLKLHSDLFLFQDGDLLQAIGCENPGF